MQGEHDGHGAVLKRACRDAALHRNTLLQDADSIVAFVNTHMAKPEEGISAHAARLTFTRRSAFKVTQDEIEAQLSEKLPCSAARLQALRTRILHTVLVYGGQPHMLYVRDRACSCQVCLAQGAVGDATCANSAYLGDAGRWRAIDVSPAPGRPAAGDAAVDAAVGAAAAEAEAAAQAAVDADEVAMLNEHRRATAMRQASKGSVVVVAMDADDAAAHPDYSYYMILVDQVAVITEEMVEAGANVCPGGQEFGAGVVVLQGCYLEYYTAAGYTSGDRVYYPVMDQLTWLDAATVRAYPVLEEVPVGLSRKGRPVSKKVLESAPSRLVRISDAEHEALMQAVTGL